MICKNCGAKIQDDAKFCPECGCAVTAEELTPAYGKEGKKVTENIYLCPDGKYRWVYELSMLKNPMILMSVVKVLLISGCIVAGYVLILRLFSGGPVFSKMSDMDRMGVTVAGIAVIFCILIAYLVVAASKGYKYCVLFEMDEEGVVHRELPKSFRKTQALSLLTVMAGLAANRPGVAGAGLLAASKTSLASTFSQVKSVHVMRLFHTIKVSEPFAKNQVYAAEADFDFVLGYIREHVPEKAMK